MTVGGDKLTPKKPMDRGSRRGAKRYIVAGKELYEKHVADQHGITGIFFQSGKEARRWISLLIAQEAGHIRNLRRQVRYPLITVRPDGLKHTVCHYKADFVYEEAPPPPSDQMWVEVIEDVKPGGFKLVRGKKVPFREEVYELKKSWFEAQYGKAIRES